MELERITYRNWAYCLKQCDVRNLRLATAKEGMLDRIERYNTNKNDRTHFDSGAGFSENFNRVNGRILGAQAEFNPLIPYAEQAVSKGYLPLSGDIKITNKPVSQVLESIAEKDAKKPLWERRVVDLGKVKTHDVPTDSFADDDTIVWLAQGKELARDYGNFLRKSEIGIQRVSVHYASSEGEDAAFGFWLRGLGRLSSSDFGCDGWYLNGDSGAVFGVSEKSAEGSPQKSEQGKSELYTLEQLQKALQSEGISGNLEQRLLTFLQKKH